jgi:hypothetical protein
MNTNWSFKTNFAGVSAAGGSIKVEEGYYNAVVTECYVDEPRSNTRVIFKVKLTDPHVAGAIRTEGMNIPGTTAKDNRMYWRALLESVGYQAAQLDSEVTLNSTTFLGRKCTVYYKPGDKNSPVQNEQYDRLSFLAPSAWESRKAIFEARKSQPASTQAAAVAAPSIPKPSSLGGNGLGTPTNGLSTASAGFASPQNVSTDSLMAMVNKA